MKCKGCGKEKKLIKAHIIPESFYRDYRGTEQSNNPKIMSNVEGEYSKRVPTGIYDTNILCEDCDSYLGEFDDYAFSILISEEDRHEEVRNNNQIVGYLINGIDESKLKLFIISLVWRASISTQKYFKNIALSEENEKLARNIICNKTVEYSNTFSFVIAKFSNPDISKSMLDPIQSDDIGIDYICLYVSNYKIIVNVDTIEFPSQFKKIVPGNDQIYIKHIDFLTSKEFEILRSISEINK